MVAVLLLELALVPRSLAQTTNEATSPTSSAAPSAGGVSESLRETARELANEGSRLWTEQRFDEAHDRFKRAYGFVHVPALGLWGARSLERAGHLVEASELYLEVIRTPLPLDIQTDRERAKSADADKATAASERQALLPRIPRLVIQVGNALPRDVHVSLNGSPLDSKFLGIPFLVNPGKLEIVGARGSEIREQATEIALGEKKTLSLVFNPSTGSPGLPRSNASSAATLPPRIAPAFESPSPVSPLAPVPRGLSTQQVAGLTVLGAGGLGLVLGGVFSALSLSDASRLTDRCNSSNVCPRSLSGDVDSYESKKTLSTVALTAGVLLSATGVTLYFTGRPKTRLPSEAPTQARLPVRSARALEVRGWFNGGQLGIGGSF